MLVGTEETAHNGNHGISVKGRSEEFIWCFHGGFTEEKIWCFHGGFTEVVVVSVFVFFWYCAFIFF